MARPPRITSPTSCKRANVKVTRSPTGCRVGGELDYLDEGTLSAAMRQRRYSSNHKRMSDMTNHDFGQAIGFGGICCVRHSPHRPVVAQQPVPAPKAGKPINAGDVLSGELNSMRIRAQQGQTRRTYQLTSEPRGCRRRTDFAIWKTGPETFQLINQQRRAGLRQLKRFHRQGDIREGRRRFACAQDAGQMSEAVITKWSVGDEALSAGGTAVVPTNAVVTKQQCHRRLTGRPQYAVTVLDYSRSSLEYWITRFRGDDN